MITGGEMINPQQLSEAFARNLGILKMQTQGLSHEDSLLQPAVRGNCLNWVLGHIAANRNRVLAVLGEEPAIQPSEVARYETDSEPITCDQPGVLKMENLLAAVERAQQIIAGKLQVISTEELAGQVRVGEHILTVRERLFGLYFHETYHTGQTEQLRQLAGANDKVVYG